MTFAMSLPTRSVLGSHLPGAYNSEIAALRSEGVTRTLSIAGVEQLFALGFALEQMHHNLAAACRSGRGLRGRTDVACPARSAPFSRGR
jgi:hypothetical protein